MINSLNFFDFDGTLMNSPTKPSDWKGGWWGKACSLLPPHIPHHTQLNENGKHLLNEKVVIAYLNAKKCHNTHTVMMTGRHWGLRHEVMNILVAFNLATEEDHKNLKEESNEFVFISGGKTLEGKIERIHMFVKDFPHTEVIEMWEDRVQHAVTFRELDKDLNIKVIVHEPPNWE